MIMDSSAPFSSSQSFTNLLFSQEELTYPETFEQPLSPCNPTPTSLSKVRWTLPEEKALASAWLNTSKDPIVSNEQRSSAFWERVASYYRECPEVANLPIREFNTCKQKWQKMNELVMKFAGCYECAERIPRSGENADDVLVLAHKLYFQDHKVKFTLDHVWRILKNEQKWQSFCTKKTKPRKKKSKLNDDAPANGEEDPMVRPIGVKAAKAKAKGKGKSEATDCVKELQSLWEIKEKDNKFNEGMSKRKLLDNLIGRSDSLSEKEMCLKDNLLTELLSAYNQPEIEEELGS